MSASKPKNILSSFGRVGEPIFASLLNPTRVGIIVCGNLSPVDYSVNPILVAYVPRSITTGFEERAVRVNS